MPGCSRSDRPSSTSNSSTSCGSATTPPCPCPPCAAYQSIDASKDIETYNCAGLAHRTYTFMGNVNEVKGRLAGGRNVNCSTPCNRCEIRHWLWEYDIHLEDADGNVLTGTSRDFHTVAGPCDQNGNAPTQVYSKNGARPLEGPGAGPSFRPPTRNQATSNNRHATPATDSSGRPIYKVRTNFTETCYCLACPP
jgi:hypothetical protein